VGSSTMSDSSDIGFFCFDFGVFLGQRVGGYRLLAIIRFMLLFGGWVVGGVMW
jgi:hypothetical protein